MATAATNPTTLVPTGWTLIADGDAGATDVLVQLEKKGKAWLRLANSLPGVGVTGGISMVDGKDVFSGSLKAGQKLYGRTETENLDVVAMIGGE